MIVPIIKNHGRLAQFLFALPGAAACDLIGVGVNSAIQSPSQDSTEMSPWSFSKNKGSRE
jgi:hypothetical protein